jgi:DNA (cytosine-5)-methyltransferase 1
MAGSWGGVGWGRERVTAAAGRDAMQLHWLPWPELAQSIPPAYTEFLGEHVLGLSSRDAITSSDGTRRRLSSLAPLCRCGQRLSSPLTGRWPFHCSHACRQAAYRERRLASVTVTKGDRRSASVTYG